MEYIIISIMTISIFTYIVYVLVNKMLAVQVHIKFLVLCACCALIISLILPRMFLGFAGLTGTLGIVIVFAMVCSFFIAYYYDDAIKKVALKKDVTTEFVECPNSDVLQTNNEDDIQLIADLTTIPETNVIENIVDITENTEVIADLATKKFFYPMEYVEQDNPPIFLEINTNDQINNSENVLENIVQLADEPDESTTIAEPMVNKYYYPVKYEEYNPKDLIACTVKINNEAEVFNSLMNLKVQADVINTLPILDTIQEHLDLSISSEPSNSYPSSDDLDFLMDFAFLHKEQRNFIQALNTFRQALLLYPDSEVAPFLVVEMGTILKNFGSYNEAIQVFIEGRLLPGVINNSMLDQEFINNIAYLRVVKNILIQNSLEFMPFNRIPNNIFKEIDAEFYEWRNQS